ncbi:hypothetical protein [Streptomyces sp. SID5606]|uniref:hypothetical protein n=1 Tax=Streptomyces sp. SID5606 TaxID=2690305 RepID=UPI00137127C6|nr:hypothetical protein [Streptomyces sp. SID5606]MZD54037.1 hypothetical protein [Streptomyces sp. SID5606]
MGQALDRVIEVLAGVSEDETPAALWCGGRRFEACPAVPAPSRRTRLPGPGAAGIVSEVEWV